MWNDLLGIGSFALVYTVYLGVCLKLGVMPTRSFRLMRRADNPDLFGAAATILSVIIYGILIIAAFGVWANAG